MTLYCYTLTRELVRSLENQLVHMETGISVGLVSSTFNPHSAFFIEFLIFIETSFNFYSA